MEGNMIQSGFIKRNCVCFKSDLYQMEEKWISD